MLTVIDKAKMFREIVNEMADLYEKKNANYGDSFSQLFDALGPISGLVPLHNKLDRATSLIKGNKNNFESLEDTFKDLACYAIMNLIEMKSRATTTGEQGELTVFISGDSVETKVPLDLPEYNLKDGKWYYEGVLADGWCYNKEGRMTGQGYRDGQPISDMVLRTYDTTPHHFIPNSHKTATVKKSEPVDFNVDPSITLLKDPCSNCPWHNQLWIGGSHPYVGDSPCQWCEHGTKITCENINYCTSITADNTDSIKLKATSSNGLEDAFVKADPSIVASTMIDECHDLDDLTIDEMLRAEREEGSIWSNIYTKFMTKRGNK